MKRARRVGGNASRSLFVILAISAAVGFMCAVAQAQYVLQYHGTADRAGSYVIPGLTPGLAQSMHLDQTFNGHVDGHVYAQPLLTPAAGPLSGIAGRIACAACDQLCSSR